VPIAEVAHLARNPCHNCCDYTSVHADISVGSVGAPDGWNSVMIRTDVGEKYINMVDGLEINDDPKPGMFLIKKLTEMKHKNNSGHYLEVCEKFSFDECGMH
jgi:coenzyme F420-reducing hydrogenase beta subunit